MGLQTTQCCCCECGVTTLCCGCVCKNLCAVIEPPAGSLDQNGDPCLSRNLEMEWNPDTKTWSGAILGSTPEDAVDLLYYFEELYGECYFVLRSVYLGYPLGLERRWPVANEYGGVSCRTMITEVDMPVSGTATTGTGTGTAQTSFCNGGILRTHCAPKITPALCTGCNCSCKCLCITFISNKCQVGAKACWDQLTQSWKGTIQCTEYEHIELTFTMLPNFEVCDPSTNHCDPDDKSCRLVLQADGTDYGSGGAIEPGCASNLIYGVWQITLPGTPSTGTGSGSGTNVPDETATIIVRCAVCDEECKLQPLGCCLQFDPPGTLFITMEVHVRLYEGPAGIATVPFNEFDCATYVFTLHRLGTGLYAWESDFIDTPLCYCGEGQPLRTMIGLTCGTDPDTGADSLVMRLTANGASCSNADGEHTITFACNPILASKIVSRNYPYLFQVITNAGPFSVASWCCGWAYYNAYVPSQPGYELSWNSDVRFTITE